MSLPLIPCILHKILLKYLIAEPQIHPFQNAIQFVLFTLTQKTHRGQTRLRNKELYLAWPGSFTVGDKFDIVVVVEDGHFRFKVSKKN